MKRIALILSAVLMLSPINILAASTAVCKDTDLENGIITIEGKMDGTEVNGLVSVEVKNSAGVTVFAGVYNTEDSSGNYTAKIGMKSDSPKGDYKIKVSSYNSSAPEITVPFINSGELQELLDAFNNATTVAEMSSDAIEKYSDIINIRPEIYSFLENADKDVVAQYVLEVRPDDGYKVNTVNKIKTDIADKMKIVAFDRADTVREVKFCFDVYDDYGATNGSPVLYEEFSKLSETDKDFAYNVIAEYKYSEESTNDGVFNAINHAVILNKINKAQSPSEITKILTENSELLPKDMVETYKLCDKTQLELYLNGVEDLSTMSKLKKAISEGYKAQGSPNVPPSDNQKPGSSGGGGGGSSGGGGGALAGKDKLPPKDDAQTIAPQTPAEKPVFYDIENIDWAKDAILYLNSKNIILGDGSGKFRPNDNITREEFTKLVVVAFGIPTAEGTVKFIDVDENNWAKAYIDTAYENGIVNGTGESKFGLGTNITRQDMAVMVLRAAEKIGKVFAEGEIISEDANTVADYAKDAMGKLMKAGIINGTGNNMVEPHANATRAQAAKIIYALIMETEVKE